ncbi:MAG: NAD(P)H-hydrate epimerase [Isosphaeraceae bacterium]
MTCLIRPLSRQEVRELDDQAARKLDLPTLSLMENAGRGAAAWLAELTGTFSPGTAARPFSSHAREHVPSPPSVFPRVLVVCGPGNNGGDGGVVARHLDAWGFPVRIVWFAARDQLHGDAVTQWRILDRSGVDQTTWYDTHPGIPEPAELDALMAGADWLVDGLFGTGLARPLVGSFRLVVEAMNRSAKPILALDLPSGLDADRGIPLGTAVRARATATFVAPKPGFAAQGASDYTGQVEVIDIGLPRKSLQPYLI